jgi:HEPN domain-containing protein
MTPQTLAWVRKAEDDYGLAEQVAAGARPFPDQVCFHCQQSAEEYLKALLEELGQGVPKTHDLKNLLDLLRPYHQSLVPLKRGLLFLSTFAVAARYPKFRSTKRQAEAALRWAGRVREKCRQLVGIHPKPPGRRGP